MFGCLVWFICLLFDELALLRKCIVRNKEKLVYLACSALQLHAAGALCSEDLFAEDKLAFVRWVCVCTVA